MYKDKKINNFPSLRKFYFRIILPLTPVKIVILICSTFLLFILLNLASNNLSNGEIILKSNENSASSFIIEALLKPNSENLENENKDEIVYGLVSEFKNGIYIYNISEPIESWWSFDCIRTKMKHSINTKLCVYDTKYDKIISAQLKQNGLWEPTNIRSFLKQLSETPDANFIDIGANIGLYTLLAAKLGRNVIAVEPLHENMNRIHKAAYLEQVQNNIIGIVNAISNERRQVKISILDDNIGGSYIVDNNLLDFREPIKPIISSVLVNSIILDDLIDVIKDKLDRNISKKFILKLDIEAFEPFAFENATKTFSYFQIPAIFMEFGKSIERYKLLIGDSKTKYKLKITNMIKMLKNLNYEPYEMNGYNKLDYSKWNENWPWDVYFRQCDLVNCPDHVYKLVGV